MTALAFNSFQVIHPPLLRELKGIPLLGVGHLIRKDPLNFLSEMTNKAEAVLSMMHMGQRVFIVNSPARKEPGNQLVRSQDVAQKIIEESKGENFNIAVIAERKRLDAPRESIPCRIALWSLSCPVLRLQFFVFPMLTGRCPCMRVPPRRVGHSCPRSVEFQAALRHTTSQGGDGDHSATGNS